MTANRKAKAAARSLAADTGRSYTHTQRAESVAFASPPDAAGPALAELHRQATELSRLLGDADPRLSIAAGTALRLAAIDDAQVFYAYAVKLAQDIGEDLRASRRPIDELFRWSDNPVNLAYALAAAARTVALDRCEVDPKDTPCSGERVLSLAVWTGDGLSETWDRLCVRHAVDYADQWDPAYAELVVGGRGAEIRRALAELHSARPGDLNIRRPRPGEDDYGRLLPPEAESDEPVWVSPTSCRFCGAALTEDGLGHEC